MIPIVSFSLAAETPIPYLTLKFTTSKNISVMYILHLNNYSQISVVTLLKPSNRHPATGCSLFCYFKFKYVIQSL